MRLSNAASYAIHALVHMAGHKDNQPLASHLTAREQGNRLGKKLQAVWDQANEAARRQLGKVRLSDLAGKR